ncbi:MAG: TonB-dependent receptor [Bacteroidota bacterium]|nr:TonB-dependent receptor [Bacteroidota bacterium]
MKSLITILIIALTCWVEVYAQPCKITLQGYVFDQSTHEPMEFASIGVLETAIGTIVDSTGYFQISNICKGTYHLQIEHLGCDPLRIFIDIKADTSITLYINHHAELLKEVVVSAYNGSDGESQSRNDLGLTLIKNNAGNTLADLTEQINGVHSLRNGSGISKPIIHGLFGNRIGVINNGLLHAGQQWGSDHAPEIDPNGAGIIKVLKGSAAIEYGSQAMGGAIIVEAGPIEKDPHIHGYAGYAFNSNGLGHTLYTRLNKSTASLGWRLSGTLKKSGDHTTPDYYLTNTGVVESNLSGQLMYEPSENIQHEIYYSVFHTQLGIFAGSHISNLTDLETAISRQEPQSISSKFSYVIASPKQIVTHHLLTYKGRKFTTANSTLEWSYGLQSNHRQEFDIRRGDRSDIPALDLQLWSHQVGIKYHKDLERINYKAGLQGSWTDNTNSYETGILPLIPDYTLGTGSAFIQMDFDFGKIGMETGVRYDFLKSHVWAISQTLPRTLLEKQKAYHDAAASLGMHMKQKNNGESKLLNVLTRRSPAINELYSNGLHQGIAGIEEGNKNLNAETSLKSILTQSISLPQILHVEVSAYTHLIYQYIYLQAADELRLTIRGAFPVYQYRQQDAWFRGVDFAIYSDFSHRLELRSTLSVIKANSLKLKAPLTFIPPLQSVTAVGWTFNDSKRWKGARVSATGTYTGRQRYWDEFAELVAPPEAYFLLSAKFETSLRTGSDWFHIGINVENLLDVRYRDYLNRLRYFADEQGRSVQINLRYEF